MSTWIDGFPVSRSGIPLFLLSHVHTHTHTRTPRQHPNPCKPPSFTKEHLSENTTLSQFTLILNYFLNMVSNFIADRINLAGYLKRPSFIHSYLLTLNRMSFLKTFSIYLCNIQENSDSPRKVKFHISYFCIRGK